MTQAFSKYLTDTSFQSDFRLSVSVGQVVRCVLLFCFCFVRSDLRLFSRPRQKGHQLQDLGVVHYGALR